MSGGRVGGRVKWRVSFSLFVQRSGADFDSFLLLIYK